MPISIGSWHSRFYNNCTCHIILFFHYDKQFANQIRGQPRVTNMGQPIDEQTITNL